MARPCLTQPLSSIPPFQTTGEWVNCISSQNEDHDFFFYLLFYQETCPVQQAVKILSLKEIPFPYTTNAFLGNKQGQL